MSTPRLRVGSGLLFHTTTEFTVGGYVSYSARIQRALEQDPSIELVRLYEPDPQELPAAEITAPHLVPFSLHVERLIDALTRSLRRARLDVCHAMEWGSVGTALFEACIRARIPYTVVVIDHKPVCAQSMLLHLGRDVCDGPSSPHACADCVTRTFRLRRPPAPEMLALRNAALSYYYRRAAGVVAFTPQHADEVARWLGRPRETIDVVPIAVPPPGSAYRKDADAFAGPLRLGFIARTCPEWGLRLVLEAWRRLKPDPSEAILDIYTSKEFEDEGWGKGIADLIERGSVTVSLEPVFDRLDEVHAPLGGMIVASQWKNNMSGAGLEGLVRGTPVITSDRHAFYESLAPEMQELAYRFGDVRSLVEVLGRVIADPGLLEARSGASAPAVEEHHHVRGVAEALRAAHAVGPGPAPAVPIQIDRPGALLIARGDWAEVLDQYLAGAVAIPRGDLVVVAPFVDALAVEETVLERLARAGLDPETCPPLSIVEALDTDAAVAGASLLLAGPDGDGLEVARACHVAVQLVDTAARIRT